MQNKYRLSDVTKNYLSRYNCILDKMIDGMTSTKLDESISHNFIVRMIPHHEAAIEMSKNILRYTTYIPVQDIAENIIEEQTKSISDMRAIECECGEHENPQRDVCLYNRKTDSIMNNMFLKMGNAEATNNINADFMREMIPHHLGAVEMSYNALQYDICAELKPLIEAIIVSQKRGIAKMQWLLKCVG